MQGAYSWQSPEARPDHSFEYLGKPLSWQRHYKEPTINGTQHRRQLISIGARLTNINVPLFYVDCTAAFLVQQACGVNRDQSGQYQLKQKSYTLNASSELSTANCIQDSQYSKRVLLRCFWGTWRYLRFPLISAIDFYYVINKLIILVSGPH
jgi:hypothetical protein